LGVSHTGGFVEQADLSSFHLPGNDFLPLIAGWVCCVIAMTHHGGHQVVGTRRPDIIVDKSWQLQTR